MANRETDNALGRRLAIASRRVLVALAMILIVAVWAGLVIMVIVTRQFGIDGVTYLRATQHLVSGDALYPAYQLTGTYLLGEAAAGGGFVYPPSAALLLAVVAPFEMAGIWAIWLAAWVALGVLSARVAFRAGLMTVQAAVVGVLIAIHWFAVDALADANANLLVADAVLAAWLWPSRSGYVAVAGMALKVFPAGLLLWTWRQRGRLAGPILFGVVLLAVTTAVAGWGSWLDFGKAMANGRSTSAFLVPSPSQALHSVLGYGAAAFVGYALAAIALLCAMRIKDEATAFAVLGWGLILAAPDWWPHYLLVPLVAALPWLCRWYARQRAIEPGIVRRLFAVGEGRGSRADRRSLQPETS